jgi:Zn-finger nucleic acid-binding protein
MKKKTPAPDKSLVLDVCPLCGGIWFDRGEVLELRQAAVETVKRSIDLSRKTHKMRCHYCFTSMSRNEPRCCFCNWKNTIDCPVCGQPMKRTRCRNLILDVCGKCGGDWFDRHELADIWNPSYWKYGVVRHQAENPGDNPAWGLADGLVFWPDGSGLGSGVVAEGAGELLSGVPEVAGVAVEGIAQATVGAVGEAAVEGLAEAAVEGAAEVAVEAVAEAAGSVAEGILEFLVEVVFGALG